MNPNPQPDALHSRWTLEGKIPLTGIAEGAEWRRARSISTGESVVLFIVRGEAALEAADAVRRAYLVEDPHLLPVQDIVVLDDPRDAPAEPGSAAADGPTTVVEYPLPPAPPLAALLAKGPLHPETARAIIGEAATGLEVARRRGVRHQFLDSNRVFVDTRSGAVSLLGIGVEAAAHVGLDRSREVASFQDTAALVALLYRALTGRSPRHDPAGDVPRPSAIVDTEIPEDLDLLCDLVLNESGEDIPETTRGLIEELEPWQSIPVTLEAYPRSVGRSASTGAAAAGAVAAAAATGGSSAPASAAPVSSEAPTSAAPTSPSAPAPAAPASASAPAWPPAAPAAEELESTARLDAVPGSGADAQAEPEAEPGDSAGQPDEGPAGLPDEVTAAGAPATAETGSTSGGTDRDEEARPPSTDAAAAAAVGPVGAAGLADASTDPAHDGEGRDRDGASTAAAAPTADASSEATRQTASEAKALVEELHLAEKRTSSAFPGHLDITLPRRPDTEAGAAASEDAAPAPAHDAPTGSPRPGPAGDGAPALGALGAAALGAGASAAPDRATDPATEAPAATPIPARTSGTQWPLGRDGASAPDRTARTDPARTEALAPTQAPLGADGRAQQPAPVSSAMSSLATPDHSAPTPSNPVTHGTDAPSAAPVAVAGRAAPVAPAREDGPIVVHGRDRSFLEETPEESTVPYARSSLLRDVVGVAVDNDAPETFTMGPRDREKRSLQSQWIIIGGAIAVMIALVIALTSITRDVRGLLEDPLATSQPEVTTAPVEEETGEAPVEPTAEETEDSLPAPELAGVELSVQGNDQEPDHTDQQERLTDGDPSSFWSTKHYGSPDYGGLKDGVGIRLDFAEPSTFTAVTVTTALNNGGLIELRAVNDDGSLGDVLSTGEFVADGEVRLEAPEALDAEAVALWIPELPPDSREDGRFRARIAEIQVE